MTVLVEPRSLVLSAKRANKLLNGLNFLINKLPGNYHQVQALDALQKLNYQANMAYQAVALQNAEIMRTI